MDSCPLGSGVARLPAEVTAEGWGAEVVADLEMCVVNCHAMDAKTATLIKATAGIGAVFSMQPRAVCVVYCGV